MTRWRRVPLRFHIPLIEPDVRFSRIRLSDQVSCLRPREVAGPKRKLGESEFLVEALVEEA